MLDDSPIGLAPVDNLASTEYSIEQHVDERVGDNIAFVRQRQAETFLFRVEYFTGVAVGTTYSA